MTRLDRIYRRKIERDETMMNLVRGECEFSWPNRAEEVADFQQQEEKRIYGSDDAR